MQLRYHLASICILTIGITQPSVGKENSRRKEKVQNILCSLKPIKNNQFLYRLFKCEELEDSMACGEIPHGDTTDRIRFQNSTVPYGSECISETQIATCNNGNLGSYSGTYTYDSCAVSETVIVPVLEGLTESEAISAINSGYLTQGEVSYTSVELESQDGIIVSQSPLAGISAMPGTQVSMTIGKYESPEDTDQDQNGIRDFIDEYISSTFQDHSVIYHTVEIARVYEAVETLMSDEEKSRTSMIKVVASRQCLAAIISAEDSIRIDRKLMDLSLDSTAKLTSFFSVFEALSGESIRPLRQDEVALKCLNNQ